MDIIAAASLDMEEPTVKKILTNAPQIHVSTAPHVLIALMDLFAPALLDFPGTAVKPTLMTAREKFVSMVALVWIWWPNIAVNVFPDTLELSVNPEWTIA